MPLVFSLEQRTRERMQSAAFQSLVFQQAKTQLESVVVQGFQCQCPWLAFASHCIQDSAEPAIHPWPAPHVHQKRLSTSRPGFLGRPAPGNCYLLQCLLVPALVNKIVWVLLRQSWLLVKLVFVLICPREQCTRCPLLVHQLGDVKPWECWQKLTSASSDQHL